jgi:hypothetical protein
MIIVKQIGRELVLSLSVEVKLMGKKFKKNEKKGNDHKPNR